MITGKHTRVTDPVMCGTQTYLCKTTPIQQANRGPYHTATYKVSRYGEAKFLLRPSQRIRPSFRCQGGGKQSRSHPKTWLPGFQSLKLDPSKGHSAPLGATEFALPLQTLVPRIPKMGWAQSRTRSGGITRSAYPAVYRAVVQESPI